MEHWQRRRCCDQIRNKQFHGSAYEFYRNSALDANLWFANHNGQAKPDFDRNQYGVSAGGPHL